MNSEFYATMGDLGVIHYCKKFNIEVSQEQVPRVSGFIELVKENVELFDQDQEKELLLGYLDNLNIDLYYDHTYSATLMRHLRECLLYNIPICKMMNRRKFTNNDIRTIILNKTCILIHRSNQEKEAQ